MIWSKEETLKREEIREIQLKRLKETVERVYNNVPHYKKKFDEVGIKPEDINSLEDLGKLPFTIKNDLRDNYPFDLFAVPKKDVVRFHASSGTTGKPTVVGYTHKDMETWTELIARIVSMAGVTNEDTAQVAFGYGLFTGAFGLHQGLEKVGAAVIPMSSGNTQKQILIMKDFGTTALICTPSYALHIAETAKEMGIDPKKDLDIKFGLFGGEGSTEAMRLELNKSWGMFATENYGMSELIGPGVSGECECLNGMHIFEDHFIPEIINPDTGEVLPDGSVGELVITPISKEALPLIRYRTKDLSTLYDGDLLNMRKMKRIKARTDDMMIIRGVNVFPSQIEEVLLKIDAFSPYYQLIITREGNMDDLAIDIEPELSSSTKDIQEAIKTLVHKIKSGIGVSVKVNVKNHGEVPRSQGKAQRVVDKRNL